MVPFRELGATIKSRWRDIGYDEMRFAELATSALAEAQLSRRVSLDDVLMWAQTAIDMPPQVENPFGKPITVFYDPRFFIDVLTWIDGTTAIHEHGFAGAFTVLSGSSLHSRYQFTAEHRYSEHLFHGRTELVDLELLTTGDVRPIRRGPLSAHSLFHLARPTVSVVVRTQRDSEERIQRTYLRSGIAYDPFFFNGDDQRAIRSIAIMNEIGHPALLERAREVARTHDPFTVFRLAAILERKAPLELYRAFLADPPPHLAGLFAILAQPASVSDFRRELTLISWRRTVHDDTHRFLLALLLNLQRRSDILRMVKARVPDREPIDVVLEWVSQMNGAAPSQDGGGLGIDLDDNALVIMRSLLAGKSDAEVIETLRAEFDNVDEMRRDVIDLCAAFRESAVFAPLFAEV